MNKDSKETKSTNKTKDETTTAKKQKNDDDMCPS